MSAISGHFAKKIEAADAKTVGEISKTKTPTKTKILRAVVTIGLILSVVGIIFLSLASAGIGGFGIFTAVGGIAQGMGALALGSGKDALRGIFGRRESANFPAPLENPLPSDHA